MVQIGYEESDMLVAVNECGAAESFITELEPYLTKKSFKEHGEEIKDLFNQIVYDNITDAVIKSLKDGIKRTFL